MKPRIEIVKPKKLVGIHMEMTLSNNKTGELWRQFMPRRKEVKNRIKGITQWIRKQVRRFLFQSKINFRLISLVVLDSTARGK
jgi:hypothetical protein